MKDLLKKLTAAAVHWVVAAFIAGAIASAVFSLSKPCGERPCYQDLSGRLAEVEAECLRLRVDLAALQVELAEAKK